MKCHRNGCNEQATHTVVHDRYPSSKTRACKTHAIWWVYLPDGRRLGKISGEWWR